MEEKKKKKIEFGMVRFEFEVGDCLGNVNKC